MFTGKLKKEVENLRKRQADSEEGVRRKREKQYEASRPKEGQRLSEVLEYIHINYSKDTSEGVDLTPNNSNDRSDSPTQTDSSKASTHDEASNSSNDISVIQDKASNHPSNDSSVKQDEASNPSNDISVIQHKASNPSNDSIEGKDIVSSGSQGFDGNSVLQQDQPVETPHRDLAETLAQVSREREKRWDFLKLTSEEWRRRFENNLSC